MMAGQLSRVAVLGLATIAWRSGLHAGSVLFVVAVCFGTISGLSSPAASTLARQLVRSDDLVTVSGWSQTGSRLARLLGAPLGAAVIQWGFGVSMLVDGLTFLGVAMVLLLVVRTRFRLPAPRRSPWGRRCDRAGTTSVRPPSRASSWSALLR
ncbi:hypothetical protein GCM10025864_11150 [Luteimicrobium album]|uniref:MFS transporter n=1 Tax=Luteimicrobium album TaxID=1054550 RepID=A0ABQ6HZA9_9MICO|nr:hypothetical protein GCM10025864_11150 [Luteimicrobium album]